MPKPTITVQALVEAEFKNQLEAAFKAYPLAIYVLLAQLGAATARRRPLGSATVFEEIAHLPTATIVDSAAISQAAKAFGLRFKACLDQAHTAMIRAGNDPEAVRAAAEVFHTCTHTYPVSRPK